MVSMMFFLNDIQANHKRSVYNTMDLSGDLGGIFGTVYFFGAVLSFLLTGSDQEQQLL